MCRYAMSGPYKEKFACFSCRKVFKQTSRFELPAKTYAGMNHACPQCGQPMQDMGHDFQAPKQNDLKQWAKVALLYQNGFTYHSCGCGGPGYRPARLQEVPAFLEEQRSFRSEGEALLYKLTRE